MNVSTLLALVPVSQQSVPGRRWPAHVHPLHRLLPSAAPQPEHPRAFVYWGQTALLCEFLSEANRVHTRAATHSPRAKNTSRAAGDVDGGPGMP